VREIRPPEPYKGKGVKYVEEFIKKKVGKAGQLALAEARLVAAAFQGRASSVNQVRIRHAS